MNDNQLIIKEENYPEFTSDQIQLIKDTICKGASDDELKVFLYVCKKTRLDPFMKQIYAVMRHNKKLGRDEMTIQTSIDGKRLVAERTGRYAPGRASTFEYSKDGQLILATSYVKKQSKDGSWHEVAENAFWSESAQYYGDSLSTFWKKMPHTMLAKCAEDKALKRAFPNELSGLYSETEMGQADNPEIEITSKKQTKIQKIEETIQEKEEIVKTFVFNLLGEESAANLSQDEIDTILSYCLAYANNHKKSMRESLDTYQDRDKFMKHVHIWKERQKKVEVA